MYIRTCMTSVNPYEVLGIPADSTFAQVRARYFQLARKHHPDKLHHLSEEERKKNEEYFQKISAAYSSIEKGYDPSSPNSQQTNQKPDHWRTVWSKVETLFQRPDVWECMRQVVKDTLVDVANKVVEEHVHTKDSAGASAGASRSSSSGRSHHIQVPVTLYDLHIGKRKKLQLFLQGIQQPIQTHLHCKNFPKKHEFATCMDGKTHTVSIDYNIIPHDTFRLDDILGTQDLYVDIDITWYDYIYGVTKQITYLDGSVIDAVFAPFARVDCPQRWEGKGLAGKGDLYISFHIQHPSNEQWSGLSADQQNNFLNILNALIHIRSGVEN